MWLDRSVGSATRRSSKQKLQPARPVLTGRHSSRQEDGTKVSLALQVGLSAERNHSGAGFAELDWNWHGVCTLLPTDSETVDTPPTKMAGHDCRAEQYAVQVKIEWRKEQCQVAMEQDRKVKAPVAVEL